MKFSDLGLSSELLSQIEKMGYSEPTPIQQQSIPPALQGRDILGCAQTGTGKTAAFAIPIIEQILAGKARNAHPYALVLAPTRELADQIRETFSNLLPPGKAEVALLVGGAAMQPQLKALKRGAQIIVATPGRLLDHLLRSGLVLDRIGLFVLDEADRMLDMGFMPQVERILRYLPRERQSLLFSATMPPSLGMIEHRTLRDPVKVSVAPSGTAAEGIEHEVYAVDPRSKSELLAYLLKTVPGPTLVFVKTKVGAEQVFQMVKGMGEKAELLHGDRSQSERNRALELFKEGVCRVLVATDVASRGLDIEGIAHVINYDMPTDPEGYVHRSGRTARAGAVGRASLFVSFGETTELKVIERMIGHQIEEGEIPPGILTHTALAPMLRPQASAFGSRRRGAPRRYV